MQAWSPPDIGSHGTSGHSRQSRSLGHSFRGWPRESPPDAVGTRAARSPSPLSVSVPQRSELGYLHDTYRSHRRRPSSPLSSPSPGYPRTPSERPSSDASSMDVLLIPQKPFARSHSPSGDSVSTVSPSSTPRCHNFSHHEALPTPKASKRCSVDRRLNELKGLVASFDFGEAMTGTEEEAQEQISSHIDVLQDYWTPEPVIQSRSSRPESVKRAPLESIEYAQSARARRANRALSHMPSYSSIPYCASASTTHDAAAPSLQPQRSFQDLPKASLAEPPLQPKHGFPDLKQANPSRRPQNALVKPRPAVLRHTRSSSEMRTAPPVPTVHAPVPIVRTREFFPVATSGYSSIPVAAESKTCSLSWRATFATQRDFAAFAAANGSREVARQEVIWELCVTERTFVADLWMVVKVFAKPLQTPLGRWMEGIPMQVANAFSAIEEIAAVHAKISGALSSLRKTRQGCVIVDDLVALLESQVPELLVHQWLLVHFAEITTEVDRMVQDPSCVFGEFIRMQLGVVDCKAQSLGDLLHKPMQRLMKYPLFVSRLLEMTATKTTTHQSLSRLGSRINDLITKLQLAKSSHEDHDALRKLETRIEGLPTGFVLAKPGRRILLDCEAQRMQVSPSEVLLHSNQVSRASSRASIISNASSFACATSSRHSRSSSAASSSLSRSPSMVSFRSGGSRASSRAGSVVSSVSSSKTSAVRLIVLDDLVLMLKIKRERSLFTRRGSSVVETQSVVADLGVSQVVDVQESIDQGGVPSTLVISVLPYGAPSREEPSLIKLAASQRTLLSTIQAALERTSPPVPSPIYMPQYQHQEILSSPAQNNWEDVAHQVRRKRSTRW